MAFAFQVNLTEFKSTSKNNNKATWPEWKIKVVFTSICVPECLLHPSALSNKPVYFQVWVCFFYRRAGTRVWKKCSLQTTSVTTTVLEVGQQAGRVFSYSQAKIRKKKKCWQQRECVCVRAKPLPSPRQLPGHSVRRIFALTHTLKPSKANSFTRISSVFVVALKPWMYHRGSIECADAYQSPRTVLDEKKTMPIENQLGPVPTSTTIFEMCLHGHSTFTVCLM